jgi:hypothetical protein
MASFITRFAPGRPPFSQAVRTRAIVKLSARQGSAPLYALAAGAGAGSGSLFSGGSFLSFASAFSR